MELQGNLNLFSCRFTNEAYLSDMKFSTIHVRDCEFAGWFLVRRLRFQNECSMSELRIMGKSRWADCEVRGHLTVSSCMFAGQSVLENFKVVDEPFDMERRPHVPAQQPCIFFIGNAVSEPGSLEIRGTTGETPQPESGRWERAENRMDMKRFRFANTNVSNIDFTHVDFKGKGHGRGPVRAITGDEEIMSADHLNSSHRPPATSPNRSGIAIDVVENVYRGLRASYERNWITLAHRFSTSARCTCTGADAHSRPGAESQNGTISTYPSSTGIGDSAGTGKAMRIEAPEEAAVDCFRRWAFVDAMATLAKDMPFDEMRRRSYWRRIRGTDVRVGQALEYAAHGLFGVGRETRISDRYVREELDEAIEKVRSRFPGAQ